MALCLVPGSGGAFVASGADPTSCGGVVALSSAEYTSFLTNLTAFGWDQAAFETAVQGTLLFFAVGLGIGLVISTVRKFRI